MRALGRFRTWIATVPRAWLASLLAHAALGCALAAFCLPFQDHSSAAMPVAFTEAPLQTEILLPLPESYDVSVVAMPEPQLWTAPAPPLSAIPEDDRAPEVTPTRDPALLEQLFREFSDDPSHAIPLATAPVVNEPGVPAGGTPSGSVAERLAALPRVAAGGGGGTAPAVLGVGEAISAAGNGGTGSGGGSGTGNGSGAGSGNGSGDGAGSPGRVGGLGAGPGAGANTGSVIPPRPKKMERGRYPDGERRKGHEGTAALRIEVQRDGRVGRVELAATTGFEALDRAAIEAAQQWRFFPAEAAGHAVAAQVEIRYAFRLVDR